MSGLNLLQGKHTLYSFQMSLNWRAWLPIRPDRTRAEPSEHPTAFGIESKIRSLDSRPALHPPSYFSLLLFMGAPAGQTSIYCGPRTALCHSHLQPLLMLPPQDSMPGILPLLPLPLLPSMSHSKPIFKVLFIPQNPAQVASVTLVLLILVFVLLKISSDAW